MQHFIISNALKCKPRIKTSATATIFVFLLFATATLLPHQSQANPLKACWEFLTKPKELTETQLALKAADEKSWSTIIPSVTTEIQSFRTLSAEQQKQYLKKISDEITQVIVQATGMTEIGLHFNLHGGRRQDYIDKGGIKLTMGDSGVDGGFSRDTRRKIYFFRLDYVSLVDILDTRNPAYLFKKSRMGDSLILFDINGAEKHITRISRGQPIESTEIYLAAAPEAISSDGHIGVPTPLFLTLPIELFSGFKQRLSIGSLSWDEQTLVAMRLIESRFIAPVRAK